MSAQLAVATESYPPMLLIFNKLYATGGMYKSKQEKTLNFLRVKIEWFAAFLSLVTSCFAQFESMMRS